MKINTELSTYYLIHQLGVLVNWELKDEFNYLLPSALDEKKIISNLRKEPTEEEIRARFCSIRNASFNVSDDCNFRCSYCSYSGNYEVGRRHNPNKMSLGTAEKMIDLLIRWMTDKRRRIKKSVNIGFYGGEALLELKLVTDIIEYAKKRFREERMDDMFSLIFRLNTNGYLLNDEIVDILVKHNIAVDVSLDGPQEEHDKFRVTKEGEDTWDVIRQNLARIKPNLSDFH
jgi:uncharacterized protein